MLCLPHKSRAVHVGALEALYVIIVYKWQVLIIALAQFVCFSALWKWTSWRGGRMKEKNRKGRSVLEREHIFKELWWVVRTWGAGRGTWGERQWEGRRGRPSLPVKIFSLSQRLPFGRSLPVWLWNTPCLLPAFLVKFWLSAHSSFSVPASEPEEKDEKRSWGQRTPSYCLHPSL